MYTFSIPSVYLSIHVPHYTAVYSSIFQYTPAYSSIFLRTFRNKTPLDSDQEVSDDNEDEWTYPERKPAKTRKEKVV